jgi:D-inositol-3-phosphate glycosyltransferase
VNIAKRDGSDSFLNRLSLRVQYRLADHIFVHTDKMRAELADEFSVGGGKISVIPFGINNTLPKTDLTIADAKQRLGIDPKHRTILFFGNIAPYKGLDYMVSALGELAKERSDYRLIIGGKPKGSEQYWEGIKTQIDLSGVWSMVMARITYIPDEEVELYFKAADVLVLPYTHVFQSGVLFLGYSFGLPVVATDVGSLADDIVEGETGFVCRPRDTPDLVRALREYFESPLYHELEERRVSIKTFANERYSWGKVGEITGSVYRRLLCET